MTPEQRIAHFEPLAVWLIGKLLADFPLLTPEDGFAVAGNFGHESNGFTQLQETTPTVAGSRGGYGWPQWTGPRRRAYEAYCARNGKDPASKEANYAWIYLELSGKPPAGNESRAIGALLQAKTLEAKVKAFENAYERAGVKHYESRLIWAERARDAWNRVKEAGTAPQAPDARPGGAVAEMASLDVETAAARLAEISEHDFKQIALAVSLAGVRRAGLAIVPTGAATAGAVKGTEAMDGIKSWIQSKTIWGAVASLGALVGPVFGLDLGQTNINDASVAINELIAAIGMLISIYGRVTATTKITK